MSIPLWNPSTLHQKFWSVTNTKIICLDALSICYGQQVLRQEGKQPSVSYFYFFLRHAKKNGFLILSFGKIDPFSLTSSSREFWCLFFFPRSRQKYAFRDVLTIKYTECGLINWTFFFQLSTIGTKSAPLLNYSRIKLLLHTLEINQESLDKCPMLINANNCCLPKILEMIHE